MPDAMLNITHQGLSADVTIQVEPEVRDDDIRRIAAELIASGEVPGLPGAPIGPHAFAHFVVDRFKTRRGGLQFYVRPKVPFGGVV